MPLMPSYMTMKRAMKRCAGWAAVISQPMLFRSQHTWACILMYHRIAPIDFVEPQLDDWNVPPSRFEQQIAALSEIAELVPLREIPDRLTQALPSAKPLVALTFDDGYANFASYALPILQRYAAPATIFPVTSTVGQCGSHSFDGWSRKHADRVAPDVCRPMDWHELEACVATALVTVGSHSHHHLKCMECTDEQLHAEAQRSRSRLHERLGNVHGNIYAYPYGSTRLGFVSDRYVNAVRKAGYDLAVTSDLGLVDRDTDRYRMCRVEAHALDDGRVLRAKVLGALAPYYLLDWLRRARRTV